LNRNGAVQFAARADSAMAEHKQKMVVIATNGFNDQRSSVAWSVA
jgi:hypothetical protein